MEPVQCTRETEQMGRGSHADRGYSPAGNLGVHDMLSGPFPRKSTVGTPWSGYAMIVYGATGAWVDPFCGSRSTKMDAAVHEFNVIYMIIPTNPSVTSNLTI